MTSSEINKAVVKNCFDKASHGRFDALRDIVTEDYILQPEGARGADGLQQMVEGYRAAFSGLTVTVEHQFAEGDHVATRFTLCGRHDGELMGFPATRNEVEVSGLTISRCRGGRIEAEWELVDVPGLLAQIGALPEPAAS